MDLDRVKDLIEILEDTDVTELNLEEDGEKINIKRGYEHSISPEQFALSNGQNNINLEKNLDESPRDQSKKEDREEIKAPMVGTFYRAPSPDAEPFVKTNDTVDKGDVVCIIEAMKLMNEIEVETDCKIVDILVEDGEAIEYGQSLFVIEEL